MKKIYLLIIVIISFFVINVSAKENDFSISSINIEDKSDTIEVNDTSLDNYDIKSNIYFNVIDDYIKYKIVIRNNTDKEYNVEEIIDNNISKYINVSYDMNKKISPNSDSILYITFKYSDIVETNQKVYKLDDISITIKLDNGKTININPNTNDNIIKYILLFTSSIIILGISIKKKNKLYIIPILLLISSNVSAINNDISINFKNNYINMNYNRFKTITNDNIGISNESIRNIYFVKEDDLPNDIDGSFDITVLEDQKITEYYKLDNELYDIYIVSNDINSKYYTSDLSNLFSDLTNVEVIDLSYMDLSDITNMDSMFYNDIKLKQVFWPDNLNTSKVKSMQRMFCNCVSLETVDLSLFNTSEVTDLSWLFGISSSLQQYGNLTSIDLSNFDTSKVTNMKNMFQNQSHLTQLDLLNFDTSNVTNMTYMFYNNRNLEDLDISFNTSNVENMAYMFGN